MAQEYANPAKTLNKSGGPRDCGPTPCWHQLQQPTVDPQHSLPDPRSKPTTMKVAQRKGWPEVTPVPFLNPNPVANYVGHSNEALVIVDRQEMTALIDSGAQVSSISSEFCGDLTLQPLGWLLELEGRGGSAIPYLRFVEVNLQIPGIKNYNEDMLLLVIPTTTYSEMVLVMVGSKIIDRAMSMMTKGIAHESDHNLETSSFLELSCLGHCSYPTQAQMQLGWKKS